MHYYQFNIGDYKSHTEHLSEMEDLAYRRLLDWYYLHETPIPLDIGETSRQIRMRSHTECIATVLQEYFERTDNGWTHGRADKEIAKTGEKSAKASESAKRRWEKEANAMRTHSEGNATHNTEPITQDTDEPKGSSSAKLPDCPHDALIDLYAKRLPELPQPRKSLWQASKNAVAMRARWRWVMTACYESGERAGNRMATNTDEGLAWFDRYFSYVSTSDWLTGRKKEWSADLGWLVNASNFEKVMQGNYENDKAAA